MGGEAGEGSGVKCMVTEGDQTVSDEHSTQYTDGVSQNYTHEINVINQGHANKFNFKKVVFSCNVCKNQSDYKSSHEKERSSDTRYNVDEPQAHGAE